MGQGRERDPFCEASDESEDSTKMLTVHLKAPCGLLISLDKPDLVSPSRHPWVLVGGHHVHVAMDALHLPQTLPQQLDLPADGILGGGAIEHPDESQTGSTVTNS